MVRLFEYIRQSLTWRIVLLVAVVQCLMLIALLWYQQILYGEFAESFRFSEEDASIVFFNLHSDLENDESLIAPTHPSLINNASQIGDEELIEFTPKLEKKFRLHWQHIIDNNPNFWFSYQDQKQTLSHGSPPADFQDLVKDTINLSSQANSCLGVAQTISAQGYLIYYQAARCPDGAFYNSQFAGIDDNYVTPSKINALHTLDSENNTYNVFVALIFTLILITPGIIYLVLVPMRKAAAIVAKVSSTGRNEQMPMKAVPTELRGFIEALNLAFKRLDEGYVREKRFRNAMAHEIRTPLTVLRARLDDQLSPEELHASLLTDIRGIQDLVDRLLELARISSLAKDFESLDLVKETRTACANCGAAAIQANVELNFDFPRSEKVLIQANATALRLAIINLINNAIQHSARDSAIDIIVTDTGCVRVRDYGNGIPDDLIDNLFQPFSRAQENKASGAHGLGLAIVAEVMRYSHGRVVAKNSDDHIGAVFELYFKLA